MVMVTKVWLELPLDLNPTEADLKTDEVTPKALYRNLHDKFK